MRACDSLSLVLNCLSVIDVCLDLRSAGGKVFAVPPRAWARLGYVDSFWLTALPPLSIAEALRLLVGVPLPERENSVKSWRDGSLYIATTETERRGWFRQERPRFMAVDYSFCLFRFSGETSGFGFRVSCLGCCLMLVPLGDCGWNSQPSPSDTSLRAAFFFLFCYSRNQ